ncbi:MAG: DUF1877 family protein [Candidatus Competibacteraceae bacterium]|nr:DUF1877 family protein [Candidatus Competibacteraceae bacterium]
MGVCCVAYAVGDDTLSLVLQDPARVWQVLEPDDDSRYLTARAELYRAPFLMRLLGRRIIAPPVHRVALTLPEGRMMDLDKSWDGLRVCLAAACPNAPKFFDGPKLSPIDAGYGPPIYHLSNESRRVAESYLAVSETDLVTALHDPAAKEAYPTAIWREPDEEAKSYLIENFRELRAFMAHLKENGLGVIIQYT